jgi:FKBP-type peptidyl-prolyl cis-trans isomerase FklB
MRNPFISALSCMAISTLLLGSLMAQQTSPVTTHPAATKKIQTAGAAKPRPSSATAHRPFTLKTQQDKTSYALGMNLGRSLHRQSVEVEPDVVARGLKDALAGGKTLLTDDEAQATMVALQNDVRARQQGQMQQVAEKNKKDGEAFLAANAGKEGVVRLPSGLQYKILTPGTGPKPSATDSVVCNYRGTLIDGTEFDSSYKRGQPATFGVGRVIKGWTEALQLMSVGSKWQLFVPAQLAYGDRGAGADIGPNATLIFEVELLSIEAAK